MAVNITLKLRHRLAHATSRTPFNFPMLFARLLREPAARRDTRTDLWSQGLWFFRGSSAGSTKTTSYST